MRKGHSRPQGLNFLLGGFSVAVVVVLYLVLAGPLDLSLYGAPQVRIDAPAVTVTKSALAN
ncbi:hypothetical protein [Jannaschia sp. LMIT008]|uniref:hypothetical protein n=1 Tax=Jannaschia maritima TaxID=3032585 RepID=UPI002810A79C|nr:hypothetical protein [Jannaschia sp. LMIT008]